MTNRLHTTNSSFKSILHSKRANIYYLQHCRVLQKDGRVLYLTAEKNDNLYWNIPIANTTVILLGSGTSITQAAIRMLASASVLIGFCGGGGTPLLMASEVEWFVPQNEYRPTEYLQGWLKFWPDESKRLAAAKLLQQKRSLFIKKVWNKNLKLREYGFKADATNINQAFENHDRKVGIATTIYDLLSTEAELTKKLYKIAATVTRYGDFSRERENIDPANTYLNHGNYLAYGLAATALWVLGIPHGLAIMHGKTRRGALVFDIADLIKDALILPMSFICAVNTTDREQEFRDKCLQLFVEHQALDFMFDVVKEIATTNFDSQHIISEKGAI